MRTSRNVNLALFNGLSSSVSQNPNTTFAMFSAEFDHFLLARRGVRFRLAEHKFSSRRRINTVSFNGNIVVVAHDEGHQLEIPQAEQATGSDAGLPFCSSMV